VAGSLFAVAIAARLDEGLEGQSRSRIEENGRLRKEK
jgi:hypothetical protein